MWIDIRDACRASYVDIAILRDRKRIIGTHLKRITARTSHLLGCPRWISTGIICCHRITDLNIREYESRITGLIMTL